MTVRYWLACLAAALVALLCAGTARAGTWSAVLRVDGAWVRTKSVQVM